MKRLIPKFIKPSITSGDVLTTVGGKAQWARAVGTAPTGGSTGQVLKKASGSDFDFMWAPDLQGGGAGGTAPVRPWTAADSQSYVGQVRAASPMAYWRLGDTDTTMRDASGNGRDGAYVGAVAHTSGLISADPDGAISLPGTTGMYGNMPYATWMNAAAFTVEALVKVNAITAGDQTVVCRSGANKADWRVRVDSTGAVVFGTFSGSSFNVIASPAGAITPGTVYHIAATWAGGSGALFINGQQVVTGSIARSMFGQPNITIGCEFDGIAANLNGVIDEVAYYDKVLTAAQILAHSQARSNPTTVAYYAASDYVTYANNLWRNTVDGNSSTPGADPSWQLMVKGSPVPVGGTSGQVLKKASTADYDLAWADDLQGSGGGGGGAAYPPGSADAPPATANAKNDEFDGTSSATWATTPTAPTAWDRGTTRPGHLYVKKSGSNSGEWAGLTQPAPTAYPYSVVTKLTGTTAVTNSNRAGGLILAASASASASANYIGQVAIQAAAMRVTQTMGGTWSSNNATTTKVPFGVPLYLKVTVTSATSVTWYVSADGWAWQPVETWNPGFTIGTIGLGCSNEASTATVEAYFDYFRVS